MVNELGMKEFVRVYKALKQRATQNQKPKDQPNGVVGKKTQTKHRNNHLFRT